MLETPRACLSGHNNGTRRTRVYSSKAGFGGTFWESLDKELPSEPTVVLCVEGFSPYHISCFFCNREQMPRRTVQGGKSISGLTVSEKMVAWSHGLREGIVVGAACGRDVFTSWWAWSRESRETKGQVQGTNKDSYPVATSSIQNSAHPPGTVLLTPLGRHSILNCNAHLQFIYICIRVCIIIFHLCIRDACPTHGHNAIASVPLLATLFWLATALLYLPLSSSNDS